MYKVEGILQNKAKVVYTFGTIINDLVGTAHPTKSHKDIDMTGNRRVGCAHHSTLLPQ